MRGHFIKPNHKCERLQQAVFVDTETDQERLDPSTLAHVLRQGWAAYTRVNSAGEWTDPEWFRFEDSGEFWAWTVKHCRPKTRLYVFCHNSNFDYPVLDAFQWLPRNGWVPDRLVIEAPPTIIRVKRARRTMLLLDTLNYFPVSLKQLGKSIGIPKLDMPPIGAPPEEWDTYNRRDVEIIMRAVQHWSGLIAEYDLGGFQPTMAGQAFAAWRHRFMHHRVLIDSNEGALSCARACYHGGRVEAFRIGHYQERVHLLDINSMYPHVMREHSYPTVLRFYSTHVNLAKLKYLLRHRMVCAHVRIRLDTPAVGIQQGDRYIFPVGEFDAHLSTPELRHVLHQGEIVKVHALAAYEHARIFTDYVDTLYQWRQHFMAQGNETWSYLIKRLLNMLYGKFGQRGIRFEQVSVTDDIRPMAWIEKHIDEPGARHMRQIMGVVQELQREEESAGSHPAIAAHVTANARMLLWSLVADAGRDNVYYCDTDSLLVNDTGLNRLRARIDPTRLGALKHEGTYTDWEIRGAKDYRFGDKTKLKGVRPSAEWLDADTVRQEKWSGLKGLLRAGNLDRPTTRLIEKHLSRRYDKGVIGPDGCVSPWLLPLSG